MKKIKYLLFISLAVLYIMMPITSVNARESRRKIMGTSESGEDSKMIQTGSDGEEEIMFAGFEPMDYYLFTRNRVGYGGAGTIYFDKYGIFGNNTAELEDGERLYSEVLKKLLNKEYRAGSYEEQYEQEKDEELIDGMSPDLRCMSTAKYIKENYNYIGVMARLYQNGEFQREEEGYEYRMYNRNYIWAKAEGEEHYEAVSAEDIKKARKIEEQATEILANTYRGRWNEEGTLYAIPVGAELMKIFEAGTWEELYNMELTGMVDRKVPIEISQYVGDKEKGFLLFNNGYAAYKLTYPEETVEKIGELKFYPQYSPDMKYMAYCTEDIEFSHHYEYYDGDESDDIYDEYYERGVTQESIAPGWYVEELSTGRLTHIPVECEAPNRFWQAECTWISKDKLYEYIR